MDTNPSKDCLSSENNKKTTLKKNWNYTNYESAQVTNNKDRSLLTNRVVRYGFLFLFLMSLSTILISLLPLDKKGGNDSVETAKWVFSSIVPLIASWVGAVMAFYFGRDNYDAATQNVLALNRETLDDLSVENIMIITKTIVSLKVDEGEESHKGLNDILVLYKQIDKDRVPVFHKSNRPRFIIHRSTISDFLQKNATNKEINLEALVNAEGNKNKFRYNTEKGFVTVSRNTSLSVAMKKMEQLNGCQDVFVTENGGENGVVLGWLTNSLINRFLTVT